MRTRWLLVFGMISNLFGFSVCFAEQFQTQVPQNPAFTIRVDEFNKVSVTPQQIQIKLQRADSGAFCDKVDAAGVAAFPGSQPTITNRGLGDINMQYYVNRTNIGKLREGLCNFNFNDATISIGLPITPAVQPTQYKTNQATFESRLVNLCNRKDRSKLWTEIIGLNSEQTNSDLWWWTSADLKPWIRKSNGNMEWRNFEGSPYPQGVMPINSKLVCDPIVCPPLNVHSTDNLPIAIVGSPIANIQLYSGGRKPLRIDRPNTTQYPLPPGLKLDDNGILSGTPTKEGNYTIYLSLTDSCPYNPDPAHFPNRPAGTGQYTTKAYRISIYKRLAPSFTSPPAFLPRVINYAGGQTVLRAAISDPAGVTAVNANLTDPAGKAINIILALKQGTIQQGVWEGVAALPPNSSPMTVQYLLNLRAENIIKQVSVINAPAAISVEGRPLRMPTNPALNNPVQQRTQPAIAPKPR